MVSAAREAFDYSLPFGRHRGRRVAEVPTDYLHWLLRTCKLSSGLRAAVTQELVHRSVAVPEPPAPPPLPPCDRCGPAAGARPYWLEDSIGRRRIRAECKRCRGLLTHPPSVPPYSTEADAAASDTPILDVLTRLEDLGVELVSDGSRVQYVGDGWSRVPPELNAIVRQCSYRLARMLGDTRCKALGLPVNEG